MSTYNLRLPESLKQAAKRIAAQDDTTMNQFFVVAIAEKISAMESESFFAKRAAGATKAAADFAWAKVASRKGLPEDVWTRSMNP